MSFKLVVKNYLKKESRVQSPASRVQSPESRVQSPESRVQSPESRVQSPESRVQSPESRVQSPESSPAFSLCRRRGELYKYVNSYLMNCSMNIFEAFSREINLIVRLFGGI